MINELQFKIKLTKKKLKFKGVKMCKKIFRPFYTF